MALSTGAVEDAVPRMSGKTERKASSIPARLRHLVGVMTRERDATAK